MSFQRFAFAACALLVGASALDTITVPENITAGNEFTLTVGNDSGSYRVYLDTTPPGYAGGQSCYLKNSTSFNTTSLDLTIPADFGPNGDFYSISIRDLSDADEDSNYVFSNAFTLTGATGNWSEYENNLQGAPLWDANSLPCSSYNCARNCAQDSYPADKAPDSDANKAMDSCIMACPDVSAKTTASSASASSSTVTSASGSDKGGSSASSTSGTAAPASFTGAASATMIPVSFVAVGGVLALLL